MEKQFLGDLVVKGLGEARIVRNVLGGDKFRRICSERVDGGMDQR